MSRRKQSRPRSVKVVSNEADFPPELGEPLEEDCDNNNNGNNSSSNTNNNNNSSSSNINNSNNNRDSEDDSNNLIISLSPRPSESDVRETHSEVGADQTSSGSKKERGGGWPDQSKPAVGAKNTAPPQIPPNFLLPSTTSPSSSVGHPLLSHPFLPPPPQLIPNSLPPSLPHPLSLSSPSTSSHWPPSTSASLDEMARRKRSPRSLSPWHPRLPVDGLKVPRCQMCLEASPSQVPAEGQEYFIDPDGTLTIKNGVCPRSLALMLFSEVSANRSRYEILLGENLVKFLLNLKQIMEKHLAACPNETQLQLVTAQSVLKEYTRATALTGIPLPPSPSGITSFDKMTRLDHQDGSNPRKRPHSNIEDCSQFVRMGDGIPYDSDLRRTSKPDNFLEDPLPTPSPSPSHSPVPRQHHFISKSAETPADGSGKDKRASVDMSRALTPTRSERDPHNRAASDAGSVGGASSRVTSPAPSGSRVVSPAPSISSVASSLSIAEAAKQMANTKRGSKILPVASADGGTRYLCPVCGLELPTDHALTVHIRSHNNPNGSNAGQAGQPNSCTICGKTLSSQSSLDRHMLVHSGERPFKCKICDMSFTTNGNMHRHARIHEKNGTAIPKPPGRKPSTASSSSSTPSTTKSNTSNSAASSSKSNRSKKESFQSHDPGAAAMRSATTPLQSPLPFPTLMTEFGSDKLNLLKSANQSQLLQYYNDMSMRMGHFMFPFGSHHPAFPYQHLMPDTNSMPYLPHMLDPITGQVLAKQARLPNPSLAPGRSHSLLAAGPSQAPLAPLAHLVREFSREPSPDLREQRSYPCNVCARIFTSQWSLDAHMETHVIVDEQMEVESGASICKICKTPAKSEESLLLHTLTHHKKEEDLAKPDTNLEKKSSPSSPSSPSSQSPKSGQSGASSPSSKTKANGSSPSNNTNKSSTGFQDLNFLSFTCKKFPLVAKVFCESKSSQGEKAPLFPCEQCGCEFPVEGARDLHEVSHLSEEYTSCPKCDTHFASSSQLQRHMVKHVSDVRFQETRTSLDDSDAGNSLTQVHFLAQFGLLAKDAGSLSISDVAEEIALKYNTKPSTEADEAEGSQVKRGSVKVEKSAKVQVQGVKQEVEENLTIKEEIDDLDNTSLYSESSFSQDEPPKLSAQTSLPTCSDTDKLITKDSVAPSASSTSLLKISTSLFGTKAQPALNDTDELSEHENNPSMPPMFPCKHCGVVLSSPKALKYHQRSHHDSAHFRCQVCSYTSTDKSTLLRHMRTHSGERPYKCSVCDYSFTTKANCERHLRQKHGLDKDELAGKIRCNEHIISSVVNKDQEGSALSTLLQSLSALSSSPASSRCPVCQVDFFTLSGLQQHLQLSPNCRLGYLCLKCKMPFNSRKAIISHMSTQHPDIPAHSYDRFAANLQTALTCRADESPEQTLVTPPPAHAHSKSTASSTKPDLITPKLPSSSSTLVQLHQRLHSSDIPSLLQPSSVAHLASFKKSPLSTPIPLSGFTPGLDERDDQPLDFSSTSSSAASQKKNLKRELASLSSEDDEMEDNVMAVEEKEDAPIDLSVPKPHKEEEEEQQLSLQPSLNPTVSSMLSELKAMNLIQGQGLGLHSKQVEELYGVALKVLLAKTLRHP